MKMEFLKRTYNGRKPENKKEPTMVEKT